MIDTLSIKSKYSKRLQRLMADPTTPSKVAFYSSVIPGLGQAYIGKAWKIPFIYAALGASIYYYDLNNKEMNSYRTAYKRRLNGFFDDEYLELARPITTEQLLLGMEFHKNYRDIAVLLSIMHQYKQENSIAKLDNIISTNEHFAMLAKELKAYILYDDGKIKGAQNILEEILNSPNISQRSNERISNILKTFEKN